MNEKLLLLPVEIKKDYADQRGGHFVQIEIKGYEHLDELVIRHMCHEQVLDLHAGKLVNDKPTYCRAGKEDTKGISCWCCSKCCSCGG